MKTRLGTTSSPRRGYVLLLTLMLIAIAGASMAAVSRRSLAKAMEASRAEESLQRRWGVLTARSALLPRAESVLSAAEKATNSIQISTSVPLRLGRLTFTLVFGDEQARLNLNTVHEKEGKLDTERVLRQLIPWLDADDLQLRPFPSTVDPVTKQVVVPFQSLGQVFAGATPEALLGTADRAGLAGEITCWTDGRISFRRASRQVLQAACTPPLDGGQVHQLLAMRDSAERPGLSVILPRLGLTQPQLAHAESTLTDASSCHSLWIIVQTPHRRWYHLAVSPPQGKSDSPPLVFEW